MQEKLRRVQRFGSIPFTNFKEKCRIVNKLQTEIKTGLRISIIESLVVYEYFELQ